MITATPQKQLGQKCHTMRQLMFGRMFFTNDLLVVMVSVLLVMVSVSVLQLKKGFSLKRSILSDINYTQ